MTRTYIRGKIKTQRSDIMKEVMQSKVMVSFFILVLAVLFLDAHKSGNMDFTNSQEEIVFYQTK